MDPLTILQFSIKFTLYTELITFIIGFIDNILNLFFFINIKCFRNNRCLLYLAVESIFILINRSFTVTIAIALSMYGIDLVGKSFIWCRARYVILQTTGMIMYTMMCFAAVDQFFSTNYRFNLRQICTMKIVYCNIFIIVCISFIHSLLFGFFVNVDPLAGCIITNPIWLRYTTFVLYPVLQGVLPIIIAATFGLLAYYNVRRIIRRQIPIQRRRFDHQITSMILLRIVLFVCLVFPYNAFRAYAVNTSISQADALRYAIVQLLQAVFGFAFKLNYAIGFYANVIISARFRRQIKYVLKKKSWKKWCCGRGNQVKPENLNIF